MLASDTAYPRLKTSFNASELERWYSPTPEECEFCAKVVRGQSNRFGFLLTLKTFQRLGYFVTSDQIPDSIIAHLAEIEKIPVDLEALKHYDNSRSRKTHVGLIRNYLNVSQFESEAHKLLGSCGTTPKSVRSDLSHFPAVPFKYFFKLMQLILNVFLTGDIGNLISESL